MITDNLNYVISFYNNDDKDYEYGENQELALKEAIKLIEQKEPIQLTEINYTQGTQKIILSYGFESNKSKQEETIKIKIYPSILGGEPYYIIIPKIIYDEDWVDKWIELHLNWVEQWEYAEANKKSFPEEKYCKAIEKEYNKIRLEENPSNAKDFIEEIYEFVKTKKEELE